MHDLKALARMKIEGNGALDTAEVIVEAACRLDEQGRGNAREIELNGKISLKKILDLFNGVLGIAQGKMIPDVSLAMQEGYSTARESIRALGFGAGMGLPNMKKYTDSMEIDTTVGVGTTITMKIALNS